MGIQCGMSGSLENRNKITIVSSCLRLYCQSDALHILSAEKQGHHICSNVNMNSSSEVLVQQNNLNYVLQLV